MASLAGIQHLCTFNIVKPLIYHPFPNVWKVSYTISAPIFVDVPFWPPHSTDKFIFHLLCCTGSIAVLISLCREDRNRMDSGENNGTWWYRTPSFVMTIQGVTPLLSRTSCATGNERFWNIHLTHPIWLHAITTYSPKWKNHYENPVHHKRWSYPCQYGTSINMDTLIVYDAFQTFGKRW